MLVIVKGNDDANNINNYDTSYDDDNDDIVTDNVSRCTCW